ncbi:MAG: hypothetical protein IKA16_03710 [Oscillospiraceae bacterium]|nr:hypothetical protein [Oscillospiraceae bacterium]
MRDELSLLQAQLTYKKRLEGMLAELRSQQAVLKEKVSRLEGKMNAERKDVDRLEGRSLTAFFYALMGQKEGKLDAERREYYAARMKYDAAARELKAIEQDIECTEEDLRDLADCELRYVQVIEKKRIAIQNAGTAVSEELLEKEQKLSFLRAQEQELEEAIEAGTAALRTANEVVLSLKHAESLGLFDVLGGGFLADMAKHETLDEAQKNVEQLQVDLQKFNKELSDVKIRSQMQVGMDRLLKFADVFFDGLLVDAAVLENIQQSHRMVDETRDQILGILRQLQTKLEEVRHKQTAAMAAVNDMIVSAKL